jgi:hypothetical protein
MTSVFQKFGSNPLIPASHPINLSSSVVESFDITVTLYLDEKDHMNKTSIRYLAAIGEHLWHKVTTA